MKHISGYSENNGAQYCVDDLEKLNWRVFRPTRQCRQHFTGPSIIAFGETLLIFPEGVNDWYSVLIY